MIEKRQYKRFEIPLPITVSGADEAEREKTTAKIENISIGGARFRYAGDVEVGSEFEISLEDRESNFANALGLVTENSGPLTFTMHAKVLRAFRADQQQEDCQVAVEFCSPLRISPIAA